MSSDKFTFGGGKMTARTLSAADVLDVCALMLKRAGLTVAQLAKHIGPQPVAAEAPKPKPAPVPVPRGPGHLSPRLEQVLDLCDCADGMSVSDLMTLLGIGQQTSFIYLDDLRERGKVTKARPQGVRAARYFVQPDHALAWVASHAAPAAPARVSLLPKRAAEHKGPSIDRHTAADSKVAKPAKDAPVDDSKAERSFGAELPPIGPHQRLQLPPDPRYPSFASVPPGCNPDTGRAW